MLLFEFNNGNCQHFRQVLGRVLRELNAPGVRVVAKRAVFLNRDVLRVLGGIVVASRACGEPLEAGRVDAVADCAVLFPMDRSLFDDCAVAFRTRRASLRRIPRVLLMA